MIVSPEKEVVELGGGEEHTTNNRMELTGPISALSQDLCVRRTSLLQAPFAPAQYNNTASSQASLAPRISSKRTSPENTVLCSNHIIIHTDSSYVINGITKWVHGWRKNNWQTSQKEDVVNRDLWEKLFSLTAGKKIEWKYVAGHSGTPGNERCDEIATIFADGNDPSLYKGSLLNYSVPLFDLSKVSSANKKTKSRSKAKAYSYLSMIDGAIMKHKTWAECEKRVKGKSGAKFKKALSAEEEEEILKGWSIK